jgi:hypothetical protein
VAGVQESLGFGDYGNLKRNGNIAMQLDRNVVFTDGLNWVEQTNFSLVYCDAQFFGDGGGDIAGRYSPIKSAVLAGLNPDGNYLVGKLGGGCLGFRQQLGCAALLLRSAVLEILQLSADSLGGKLAWEQVIAGIALGYDDYVALLSLIFNILV